jgi:F0F1-type ATP synthase membrane subunit b/b'
MIFPDDSNMLLDETFWVAVSITLILLVIFKYSKSPFKNSLTNRATNISNQIEKAQSLLAEAEKLLEEQKKLHKKYTSEANHILNSIDEKIVALKHKAEKDFEEKIKHRTSAIKERIINQQNKLLNILRIHAVQVAIKATAIILQRQENHKINDQILSDSLNNLSAK